MAAKKHKKALDDQIKEAVLETAKGLYDVGAIDVTTMREYKVLCSPPEIEALSAQDIKKIRLKEKVSQTVFAKLLNISPATIKSWEQGDKHPRGSSLILLNLVKKRGLKAIQI